MAFGCESLFVIIFLSVRHKRHDIEKAYKRKILQSTKEKRKSLQKRRFYRRKNFKREEKAQKKNFKNYKRQSESKIYLQKTKSNRNPTQKIKQSRFFTKEKRKEKRKTEG